MVSLSMIPLLGNSTTVSPSFNLSLYDSDLQVIKSSHRVQGLSQSSASTVHVVLNRPAQVDAIQVSMMRSVWSIVEEVLPFACP